MLFAYLQLIKNENYNNVNFSVGGFLENELVHARTHARTHARMFAYTHTLTHSHMCFSKNKMGYISSIALT